MKKMANSLLTFFLLALMLLPFSQITAAVEDTPASVKTADDFVDLRDLPKETKDKFDSLIRAGVFNGLTEDTFGVNDLMNRAQFAKVAAIIFKLNVDLTLTTSSFTDVRADDPSNSYALPYIEALKKAGLTNGYDTEGKIYNPSGLVSRQELATFLIRGLGLEDDVKQTDPVNDDTVDEWANGYVALALEKKLLTNQNNGDFGGTTSATRSMLALASFEAKKLFEEPSTEPEPETSPKPTPTPTTEPEPEEQAGEISPEGKKVLFVGRDAVEVKEDDFVAERLKDLGFRVTRIVDRKFTAEKTEGYDLIYISQTTNSKYLKGGVMKDVAIPTFYAKNHGMYYLGLSSVEENANALNVNSISIVDSKHKVVGDLSDTVDVYKKADPKFGIGYGLMGKEAKVIATVPGDKTKGTIYYYDKGTKADNGYEVKARISFFFLSGNHEEATEHTWKLLDNLVVWTLQNG